jgi:hypothetical protein
MTLLLLLLLFLTLVDILEKEALSNEGFSNYIHSTMQLRQLFDWAWNKFQDKICKKTLKESHILLFLKSNYISLTYTIDKVFGSDREYDKDKELMQLESILLKLSDMYTIFSSFLARQDSDQQSIDSLVNKLQNIQLVAQVFIFFIM